MALRDADDLGGAEAQKQRSSEASSETTLAHSVV